VGKGKNGRLPGLIKTRSGLREKNSGQHDWQRGVFRKTDQEITLFRSARRKGGKCTQKDRVRQGNHLEHCIEKLRKIRLNERRGGNPSSVTNLSRKGKKKLRGQWLKSKRKKKPQADWCGETKNRKWFCWKNHKKEGECGRRKMHLKRP